MRRAFLIVLDSLGIGKMPDSEMFGDKSPNTLKTISKSKAFSIPNLIDLGVGNIEGVDFLPKALKPKATVARMTEKSNGKDTTTGHWEIAGLVSSEPLPTYPKGFPNEIIKEFSRKTGRGVLCNSVYSGTEVIMDFGKEHVKTGDLIVYTSADSVFQIAAHEDIVPLEKLYEYCKIARKILNGKHSVGRVIARPFSGEFPNFVRTTNRRDFSLSPKEETLLDALKNANKSVIGVGKIWDIFAGKGITEKVSAHSNNEAMNIAKELLSRDFQGLCFVNLVDFDMLFGHRQNVDGYANALSEFDAFLPSFLNEMKDEDVLFITADHGCDPGDDSTDHTREYTPLIVYGKQMKAVNLGTLCTFSDIAATIADYFNLMPTKNGKSFLKDIIL